MSTEPQKFRKKPVEIEAMGPLDDENAAAIAEWCGGRVWIDSMIYPEDLRHPSVDISTLEGDMTASPGDWVIRGVAGEFYPCKPDIFAATYEAVKP